MSRPRSVLVLTINVALGVALGVSSLGVTRAAWPVDTGPQTPDSPAWTGVGHFVTESIGYTDGAHARAYAAAPNFRQASGSLNTAQSSITGADAADVYINFNYDTSGKSVYVVYTTNGSAPNKANGTSVNAAFSKYAEPNRTWYATIPAQSAGTTLNYVFYVSDGTLANAWGRISGTPADRGTSQYQFSGGGGWTESDNAYFSYTVQSGATSTPTVTPSATPTPSATNTPGGPTATSSPTATFTPTPPTSCAGASAGDGAIAPNGLFHDNTISTWLTPTAAITSGQTAAVRLRTCQNDVESVAVRVWTEGWGMAPRWVYTATLTESDDTYDYWDYTVPGPGSAVNMYYQFRVQDGATVGRFHPASGNFGVGQWVVSPNPADPSWKISVTAGPPQDFAVPGWMKDAVIYQIFPDRFRDGNPSNNYSGTQVYGSNTCNGYSGAGAPACITSLHPTWTEDVVQPSYGIDFFGGDLAGITEKINANYFNDLGVNTLYLNPIFAASSNHGYDTNDYFRVNPRFGTLADFDAMMAAANAKGLRVILDAVFNHVGMDSDYIDKDKNNNGACASIGSAYRPWFIVGGAGAEFGCASGWGWAGWWNQVTLPEVVDANADARDFFFRGGSPQIPVTATGMSVSEYWIDRGIAGWRYDVAQDITHDFFQAMRPYVKQTYGTTDTLMLGEVTGGCQPSGGGYINPQELDSMMNYCFRNWIESYAKSDWTPGQFDAAFQSFRNNFGASPWYAMMNLISSHDSPRMKSLLGDDTAKLKFAVITQMTLPGAPSVYYGDEVGLSGSGDPSNRRTYPWADKGGSPDTALYDHFKQLISIRNAHPALRGGAHITLAIDNANFLYSYLRSNATEKLVVILNNSGAAAGATVPVGAHLADGGVLTDLLNGGTFTVTSGSISANVAARWGRILHITTDTSTPTPTPTPSSTPTPTPTVTGTPPTATPSPTATSSPTATYTPTPTATAQPCGPTTITDATGGTATNDGTVNGGEYAGSSCGINSGFGNVIGSGSRLHLDGDSGGALNLGFEFGGGTFNDAIVIYIDSAAGGFTSTRVFTDGLDYLRAAISARGTTANGRADVDFAPGFTANYAIALHTATPTQNWSFAGLWQLNNGAAHTYVKGLTMTVSGSDLELSGFSMSDIGNAAGGSFTYIATLLNPTDASGASAYRSNEFHGVAPSTVPGGNIGVSPVTLATGDFNTFDSIAAGPTPTPTPSATPTNTPTPTPTVTGTPPTPTSTPSSVPLAWSQQRAIWLDQDTIAWNSTAGASYRMYYDPDGGATTASPYLALSAAGTVNGASYPKNPNAGGMIQLKIGGGDLSLVPNLLTGQVLVASVDGGGTIITATGVQIQGVLDALYATAAKTQTLGVSYNSPTPTIRLWAPTARSVALRTFADSTTPVSTTHVMTRDAASGVWSVTGDAAWDRRYYQFEVEVYVPALDQVVVNVVSDPYSVALSPDTAATDDPRSQFVNLSDADTKPAGWDITARPPYTAPEDIAIYEVHVRDFSVNDTSVTTMAHRGTYLAFTYDGAGGRPLSNGMSHLKQLQQAGMTHIHLLPAFDIASVNETGVPRAPTPDPVGFPADSATPQTVVSATRFTDGFNWGYDPMHFGAPDGSYASDPDGAARVREFREMVQTLHVNGLRVVMDVVYNHMAAFGQEDKSVFDKIVPGYFHRLSTTGAVQTSSCCADTASEYAMMEDLMIDLTLRFAQDYKVDGFRFDLMNLHTVQNMTKLRDAVQAVDPSIYVYGEGWDFGSAKDKGLDYAKQTSMAGTGIGTFNDRIRDAAHGGFNSDPLQIRHQGFINGLSFDWNGYCYGNRAQSDLWSETSRLRTALKGSGDDYTDDPQETINYVEKHDNETLFDQNVFKLPNGTGNPGACGGGAYVVPTTSITDRVRSHNLGTSIVALAQGIPFFQMGQDVLRSKSLDRNSYDSGDWFNKVDWTYADNNFAKGLPPAWDNQTRWGIMGPLLSNTQLMPATANIQGAAAHMREMLRVRSSSPLFRLRTEADANSRVAFFNTDNAKDGLIVMTLSDAPAPDLDPNWEFAVVLINAHKIAQSYSIPSLIGNAGMQLHPVLADGTDADPVVQGAQFNGASGTFTVPARTAAVFVSTQAPAVSPTTLDWVGLMWPRGGVAHGINQGAYGPSGFDVYVQVYEPGVTPGAGQGGGIACYLHWGEYGQPWADLAMSFNGDIGNNDEYRATLSQATLNALGAGTYGFNAYCQKPGEDKFWKQDAYDIGSNPADDDQGDGLITIIPAADPRPAPPAGAFVHLFEWRWADVEKECTYLAQKGYTGVQISPPSEHMVPEADMGDPANDFPWWVRYQTVSFNLGRSRSGTLAEFQSMLNTCNGLGVDVIADAVINHMTGLDPDTVTRTGTFSSTYSHYDYPDFDPADFNACGTNPSAMDSSKNNIVDYGDRRQVQTCELLSLADLKSSDASVRSRIRGYLQALVNMGVKGFRIDAAKHMPAHDIGAILGPMTGTFYVFNEVIDTNAGERVRSFEYTPYGDVTEFYYSQVVGEKFNGCSGASISQLQGLPFTWLPSRFALVFADNHDNQRGHGAGGPCIIDHRDGQAYNLANVFMLAHPYGDYVSVMSSYYWSNNPASSAGDSKGPPSTTPPYVSGSGPDTRPVYSVTQSAGEVPANCSGAYEDGKWACEHRRPSMANMVGFRLATAGEPISGWVSVSANHIAFGRGDAGYVAINREASPNTRTYTTTMSAGFYCDVTRFDFDPIAGRCTQLGSATPVPPGAWIKVESDGRTLNQNVAAMDAFAIHRDAKIAVRTLNLPHTRRAAGGAW